MAGTHALGMVGDTLSDDAHEAHISHFIPSVELRGSRSQKLEQLDTLIAHLERLRRRLRGEVTSPPARYESASPYAGRVAWPWFLAGVVASGVLVLLPLVVRSCAL